MPTDAQRRRWRDFRWRPVRPRPRCRRGAVPVAVPGDHPSASWAYCAVRERRRPAASAGGVDKLRHGRRKGGQQQGCRTHQGLMSGNEPTAGEPAEQADQPDPEPEPVTEVPGTVGTRAGAHRRRSRRPSAGSPRRPVSMRDRRRRSTPRPNPPPRSCRARRSAALPPRRQHRADGSVESGCAAAHPAPRRRPPPTGAATQLGVGDRVAVGHRCAGGRRGAGHRAADPRLRVQGVAGGNGPLDDPELRRRDPEG